MVKPSLEVSFSGRHNLPEHILVPPQEWIDFWDWLVQQPAGPVNFGAISPLGTPYDLVVNGEKTQEGQIATATVDDPTMAIAMARSTLEAGLKNIKGSKIFWRIWPQLQCRRDDSSSSILWRVYARYLISVDDVPDDNHFDMAADDYIAEHVDHLTTFKAALAGKS